MYDRENNKHLAPLKARQGACVVAIDMNALRAKVMQKKAEKPPEFIPIDLNEANVQAIFNRCLAKEGATETTASSLYFSSLGWEKEDDGLLFDKKQIRASQKSLQYLLGQLKPVHEEQHILTLEDMTKTYQGAIWAKDRASLMQLLYLGSSDELTIFAPLAAKWNGTTLEMPIAPTFSPKDPAFPAWWEAHKAEWDG